ncbi:hypothetical protein COU37_03845 [Candidatus Micrarchaeota archaeon CG10_big_fil_rev_8_21_14_0_10_45_29]|nr:MAG: hypothetical protein COU37_03845 [Candidatus Micrarchaeota archaeon CG10_big_fil_rev_8_21_14_0_10_45_29]
MSAEIALLREMKKDAFWLDAHLYSLLKEHNDEFIAVKNEQLVAYGSDLDVVLSELKKIGLDTSKVLIRFISKNKFVLGG